MKEFKGKAIKMIARHLIYSKQVDGHFIVG